MIGASRSSYTFEGKRYRVGEVYRFEELPPGSRRDVLRQRDELQSVYGKDPRAFNFRFIILPYDQVLRTLERRFGQDLDQALREPEIIRLAKSIKKEGLKRPPVGEEGWETALAFARLGTNMPYFDVVEPFEFIPALEGPAKGLPPEHQKMREGFWRMMQRIALGIPGFAGTGTVEGGQFTGELAGVRTAWPVRPHGTALFETVPIAGFYLFGQFWPQMLGIMGLAGMNFSKLVEKLEKEFGRTPEYDLLRGTVPMPIWGEDPFMGADHGDDF